MRAFVLALGLAAGAVLAPLAARADDGPSFAERLRDDPVVFAPLPWDHETFGLAAAGHHAHDDDSQRRRAWRWHELPDGPQGGGGHGHGGGHPSWPHGDWHHGHLPHVPAVAEPGGLALIAGGLAVLAVLRQRVR